MSHTQTEGLGLVLILLAYALLYGALWIVAWIAAKVKIRNMWRRVDAARRAQAANNQARRIK